MTTQAIGAVALAVAGASGYAVSAWMQQAVVGRAADWREVVRSRRWLAGAVVAVVAAGLHAVALTLAPLVIVQPIGVTAIAISAVLAARSAHARLTRPAILAITACLTGVGVFVALCARSPGPASLPHGAESHACEIGAALIALFAFTAWRMRGRKRCVAYAASAAVSYSLVSVLIRVTAARGLDHLSPVTVPALAASWLLGVYFAQRAYASGPPQVVVAAQTVLDPMFGIGIGIGIVLLGEGAWMSVTTVVLLVASGLLAIAGVFAIARYRATHPADDRPDDENDDDTTTQTPTSGPPTTDAPHHAESRYSLSSTPRTAARTLSESRLVDAFTRFYRTPAVATRRR